MVEPIARSPQVNGTPFGSATSGSVWDAARPLSGIIDGGHDESAPGALAGLVMVMWSLTGFGLLQPIRSGSARTAGE